MVERNPSSALPLRRGEHNAGQAVARAHRGDCPDEPGPEAEAPDRLQWAEVRTDLCALDASDGARRGEEADAVHPRQGHLGDADAGKLAARERDVREQDASWLRAHRLVLSVQRGAAAELCTRGAARSAEQSCAAQAAAVDPQSLVARPGAAVPLAAQMRQRPMEVREQMAQPSEPAVSPDVAVEARQQVKGAQIPMPRAFPPVRIRLEAAVQARELKVRRAVALQQAEPALRPEGQLLAWPQPEAQAQDALVALQPLPSFG